MDLRGLPSDPLRVLSVLYLLGLVFSNSDPGVLSGTTHAGQQESKKLLVVVSSLSPSLSHV